MNLKQLKEAIYSNPQAYQPGFDRWLTDNYAAFLLVKQHALKVRAKVDKYAIGTLWEVVRHHSFVDKKFPKVELNNDWRADVAVLLMQTEPKLAGFFDVRIRKVKLGCYGPQLDAFYPMEDQLAAA